MTTQIPQNFVQAIAKERGVTDAELETVFMALDGQATAAIATKLGISDIAVRKRLGEVYKKFQIGGNGPGKLSELRHQLLFLHQTEYGSSDFSPRGKGTLSKIAIGQRHEDWGEAPDVSVFYGRTEELTTLNQWILSNKCRLVAVLGLPGSGKTTLSVHLAKQIQNEFDFVIWRSLRSPLPAEEFLANLIQVFSNQQKPFIPADFSGQILRLVEYLRKHRCLLILDDFESVLNAGELAGHYREGCAGYRELILRLAEVNHKSCLVLISAEEPTELTLLAGEKVRSLKPAISEEIAREIFHEKGLSAKDKEWKELLARYGKNLLAFKIVAATVSEFFEGNAAKFLEATGLFIEENISTLLAQQFDRLSSDEAEIAYWLAVAQSSLSLAQLREDMLVKPSLSDLLKNIDSLSRRSLIEKINEGKETVFVLQPLIVKYVADLLADRIRDEILEAIKTQVTDRMQLLKSHKLSANAATLKGEKENPSLDILGLVKNRLQSLFLKTTGYEAPLNILTKIAADLKDKSVLEVGYAGENMADIISELRGA